MRFKVVYMVGKSKRETILEADDLDHAEKRAEDKGLEWVDILYCNADNKKETSKEEFGVDAGYKFAKLQDGGMPDNEVGSCA